MAGDRTAIALRNLNTATFEEHLYLSLRPSFDDDRARKLADSLAMLLLGMYHHGVIDHGERFADALREPEFRDHVKALVRMVVPIEDGTGLSSEPCAP